MKKITNDIFITNTSKPLILILIYLILRDFTENIPYLNLLVQSQGNRLVVIWIVFILVYYSSLTINKIIVAIVFFLLLNIFNMSVGLIIYISLFFVGSYYLKQLSRAK